MIACKTIGAIPNDFFSSFPTTILFFLPYFITQENCIMLEILRSYIRFGIRAYYKYYDN